MDTRCGGPGLAARAVRAVVRCRPEYNLSSAVSLHDSAALDNRATAAGSHSGGRPHLDGAGRGRSACLSSLPPAPLRLGIGSTGLIVIPHCFVTEMELECSVQSYAWGKVGSSSEVARLATRACSQFNLAETQPYAELWMGTHPNGPARLAGTGELLSVHLASNPDQLGERVVERFGQQLPYLFKVLSVNKALSIQAHPNKQHAEQLHAERPDVYKDPNHKPEIAVALTEFEGLCGFRPLQEIQAFLTDVPELRTVVGEAEATAVCSADQGNYSNALQDAFSGLMRCEVGLLQTELAGLAVRLAGDTAPSSRLLARLHSQFPGDVGCFVLYFLNHLTLQPGEAMFLGPNVPHAYLAGDCVELMANSDNVVRAGLTPKLIDVATLVEMLDYTCSPAATRKFPPSGEQGGGQAKLEFSPPVPDFAVTRWRVEGEAESCRLETRDSASLVLVTQGSGNFLASHQVIAGAI